VERAAILSFAVAAVAGTALAAATTWWLLVVGGVCLAAAWLYTGGPKPYGYYGFGELFVFVFFGLVATVGSAYVHLQRITGLSVLAALPVGLLATALLIVNNLRDIPTDAVAGKKTLAVRIGDRRTRVLYAGCMSTAIALSLPIAVVRPVAWFALLAAAVAVKPVRAVLDGAGGRDLIPVLQATGQVQLLFGGLLALGIVVS
jgi:1,4-dihydroxy-2-naphthoate octaprenyltransferase